MIWKTARNAQQPQQQQQQQKYTSKSAGFYVKIDELLRYPHGFAAVSNVQVQRSSCAIYICRICTILIA